MSSILFPLFLFCLFCINLISKRVLDSDHLAWEGAPLQYCVETRLLLYVERNNLDIDQYIYLLFLYLF